MSPPHPLPASTTRRNLWLRILRTVFAKFSARQTSGDLEETGLLLLKQFQTRVLIVDQLEHCFQGRGEGVDVMHTLKDLAMQLNAVIVGLGMPMLAEEIEADEQFSGRFEPYELPRWEVGETTARFLATYEQHLPLPRSSMLGHRESMEYIVKHTNGTLYHMVSLIRAAAVAALQQNKEAIDLAFLQSVPWVSPLERRRVVRRAAKQEKKRHRRWRAEEA